MINSPKKRENKSNSKKMFKSNLETPQIIAIAMISSPLIFGNGNASYNGDLLAIGFFIRPKQDWTMH